MYEQRLSGGDVLNSHHTPIYSVPDPRKESPAQSSRDRGFNGRYKNNCISKSFALGDFIIDAGRTDKNTSKAPNTSKLPNRKKKYRDTDATPTCNGGFNINAQTINLQKDIEQRTRTPTALKKRLKKVRDDQLIGSESHSSMDACITSEQEINDDLKPCTSSISECELELNAAVSAYVKEEKKFQDKMFKINARQGKFHRRIITGVHESLKFIKADEGRMVIVARNMDAEMFDASVTHLMVDLEARCSTMGVPFIRAGTKKSLSRLVARHPYTSIITLLRSCGRGPLYRRILALNQMAVAERLYELEQPSLFA